MPLEELRDRAVVRQLVEVEAGLLRLQEVDHETQPADLELDLSRRLAEEHAGLQLHPLGPADAGIVSLNNRARPERAQRFDDERLPLVHREGERLQHQVIAVAVDDHAGKPVALAPDEAAKTWIDPAAFAVCQRLRDSALEKIEVELLAFARETPRDDLRLAVVDRAA